MVNGGWAHRLLRRRPLHPILDPVESTQIIGELRLQSPAKLLAEATAWLDSLLERDTVLDAADRLRIVHTIDGTAFPSLSELELCYAGVRSVPAGRLQEWRVLTEYLERLLACYETVIEAQLRMPDGVSPHELAALLARTMRAATHRLCASWMRYRDPERSGWSALAGCYATAVDRQCDGAGPKAGGAASATTPAGELAAAVMLAAAEPHTLSRAEIALSARLAVHCASSFICSVAPDPQCHWAFHLAQGTPVRFEPQASPQRALIHFGGGSAPGWLRERLDASRTHSAPALPARDADAFAPALTRRVLEHLLHYWSEHPPSRREARTRVDAPIGIVVGVPALKRALAHAHDGRSVTLMLEEEEEERDRPARADAMLFDCSAHGLGARIPRHHEGHLQVRGVVGFRLERSEKWSAARVRRLRADMRDEIEVGAEIIGRTVSLVAVAPHLVEDMPPVSDGALSFQQLCILLPEDPRLDAGPSLLFQPGTHHPGQLVTLSSPAMVRCARLGATIEVIDGWDRVALEWV